MEPDIHKILSNKIRMAEGRTVEWNKAEVWNKVQAELPGKGKKALWYWSAAAAISIVVIFYTLHMNQQREVETPFAQNENPMENSSTKNSEHPESITMDDGETLSPAVENPYVAEKPRKKALPMVARETHEHETERLSPQEDVALIDDTILVEEVISEKEGYAITQQKIEPIIGVYYPQEAPMVNQKSKRKTRLLKDEAEESKPWNEPFRNRIMLARNK